MKLRFLAGSVLRLRAIALMLCFAMGSGIVASTGSVAADNGATPTATPPAMAGMGTASGSKGMGGDQHMVMTQLTGQPTAQDQATADAILAKTKAATAKYQDIRAAWAAGYTMPTDIVVPGVGIHLTNPAYWEAAVLGNFDPTKPPSLLYNRVNGAWKLVGVMYVAPRSDTPQDLAQILPSTLASWHKHLDICVGSGLAPLAQRPAGCALAGGTWWTQSPWMVHAWIWQANPDGMFAIKNPTVQPK